MQLHACSREFHAPSWHSVSLCSGVVSKLGIAAQMCKVCVTRFCFGAHTASFCTVIVIRIKIPITAPYNFILAPEEVTPSLSTMCMIPRKVRQRHTLKFIKLKLSHNASQMHSSVVCSVQKLCQVHVCVLKIKLDVLHTKLDFFSCFEFAEKCMFFFCDA